MPRTEGMKKARRTASFAQLPEMVTPTGLEPVFPP